MYTGRLTADAMVRNVKGDKTVTGFTVAINKRFKDSKGEKQERTAYIVCSYWRGSGIAPLLKKGTLVSVTGWPGSEAWVDKDGTAHSNITLSVDNIQLFGKGGENTTTAKGKGTGKATAKPAATGTATDDDDLPF
jgi:single-strand DNA-binding protein